MSRRVHLVGSIGLDTVDEVFTTVGRLLGPHLKRVPDGEVGGRRMWISWQAPLLRANPFLQVDSSSPQLSDFAPLRIADGVDPEELHFGELGYAREARASYLDLLTAQSRGDLPSAVRFQVSLPTPWANVGVGRFGRAEFQHVFRAYERAMLEELARLCCAIPHEHLSVQWDIAHEMIIFDGRWHAPYEMWRPFPGMAEYSADNVSRLIAAVPAEVETGIHLCYGDRDGHHFIEPLDSGKLVEFATHRCTGSGYLTEPNSTLAWYTPLTVSTALDAESGLPSTSIRSSASLRNAVLRGLAGQMSAGSSLQLTRARPHCNHLVHWRPCYATQYRWYSDDARR